VKLLQVKRERFKKTKKDDGITLPYIYIGNGELTTSIPSTNIKDSLLFKIISEYEVINYLKFEFGFK